MNILAELRSRFATALVAATGDEASASLAEMVLPSQDAKFGDYQANCAMQLGKKLGKPPREVAAAIVAKLDLADLCEPPQIAGPGFINLKLQTDALAGLLQHAARDADRLAVPLAATPRRYVVDFSAPNVAKPMHVGHIRSTVIGDALCRVLKFLGHSVTSDNHIGDWGTQFGMIIYGWNELGNRPEFSQLPLVQKLGKLYIKVNWFIACQKATQALPEELNQKQFLEQHVAQLRNSISNATDAEKKALPIEIRLAEVRLAEKVLACETFEQIVREVNSNPDDFAFVEEHPNIEAKVLNETAKLHKGDKKNRSLWSQFLPACLEEIDQTYRRLGVTFDHTLGESFYEDKLSGVVEDLKTNGHAVESQGAICVFLKENEPPFIIQKKDGAFLYATTDLATIQYRMREWRPDAILYVVDHRQSDHFKQLFATARLWGYADVELEHVSFGTVLGDDGKPFKTRSGASIGLMGLLDEAVERAYAIAAHSDALTTEEERRAVAERIGIGAIKYADLAHNRTSDYKFSYDKMLAMTGNTAAYMQYSYARVKGIFSKAIADFGLRIADLQDDSAIRNPQSAISLDSPHERALAVALLQFPEALDRVVADYRPNNLTDYLFDLASRYAAFFENCPVLKAETDKLRTSRLILCDLTARTLKRGLNLLGIETVERM